MKYEQYFLLYICDFYLFLSYIIGCMRSVAKFKKHLSLSGFFFFVFFLGPGYGFCITTVIYPLI